jgi:prevent-host-death family protein
MIRISSTELETEVDRFLDAALKEPVLVSRDGRERVVLISAEEFHRLEGSDRRLLVLGQSRNDFIEAIKTAALDPRHNDLYGVPDEGTA